MPENPILSNPSSSTPTPSPSPNTSSSSSDVSTDTTPSAVIWADEKLSETLLLRSAKAYANTSNSEEAISAISYGCHWLLRVRLTNEYSEDITDFINYLKELCVADEKLKTYFTAVEQQYLRYLIEEEGTSSEINIIIKHLMVVAVIAETEEKSKHCILLINQTRATKCFDNKTESLATIFPAQDKHIWKTQALSLLGHNKNKRISSVRCEYGGFCNINISFYNPKEKPDLDSNFMIGLTSIFLPLMPPNALQIDFNYFISRVDIHEAFIEKLKSLLSNSTFESVFFSRNLVSLIALASHSLPLLDETIRTLANWAEHMPLNKTASLCMAKDMIGTHNVYMQSKAANNLLSLCDIVMLLAISAVLELIVNNARLIANADREPHYKTLLSRMVYIQKELAQGKNSGLLIGEMLPHLSNLFAPAYYQIPTLLEAIEGSIYSNPLSVQIFLCKIIERNSADTLFNHFRDLPRRDSQFQPIAKWLELRLEQHTQRMDPCLPSFDVGAQFDLAMRLFLYACEKDPEAKDFDVKVMTAIKLMKALLSPCAFYGIENIKLDVTKEEHTALTSMFQMSQLRNLFSPFEDIFKLTIVTPTPVVTLTHRSILFPPGTLSSSSAMISSSSAFPLPPVELLPECFRPGVDSDISRVTSTPVPDANTIKHSSNNRPLTHAPSGFYYSQVASSSPVTSSSSGQKDLSEQQPNELPPTREEIDESSGAKLY